MMRALIAFTCCVVFCFVLGVNHLYQNTGGGRFELQSAAAVGSIATDSGSSNSAAWGDYDGDGDLDLFVANYNGSYTPLA